MKPLMRLRDISDHKSYGFGLTGQEISMNWKHKNNKKRLTTIAAISINGLLVTKTVEGSVNKEVYQQFLEENLEIFRDKLLIPTKRSFESKRLRFVHIMLDVTMHEP